LGINLALGLVLWFGFFTDYSLAGTVPDFLFPPLVGLVGFLSWRSAKNAPNKIMKRVQKLFSLPSFIGGCLPVPLMTILIIPPFTLGFLFALNEVGGETRIQQAVSPDGSRMAEVYFRGVGAYSGGNGRIYVRVKYCWFPFVERDIYYLGKSFADEETNDYLHWVDDDTLFISETQREVKVGTIDTEIPVFLSVPLLVIRSIVSDS